MKKVTAKEIAKMIDHSLLKPEMTKQQVIDGCNLAAKYDCATVCVKPCDVELAYSILQNTDVLTTTVIGFPHGANLPEVKLSEAELAIKQGCRELDFVLNIGRLKSKDYDLVEADLAAVVKLAHAKNVIVKVIFENFYLTDEEKVKACEICVRAGADMTKTSTGYAGGGATIPDLRLMRANTPLSMQVKAAGGVRTLDAALNIRAIGVSRFGCTATEQIMKDAYTREANGTLILPLANSVTELGSPLGY